MSEQQPQPKGSSVKYVVAACCVFGGFVVIATYLITRASPATQQVIAPIVTTGLCGGMLKLINILQNRETDRRVAQDLSTTTDVHRLVNGGLHDRMKAAMREVLAEQSRPVVPPPPLASSPAPPPVKS